MGLFSRMREPQVLKEDGSLEEQLRQLEDLLPRAAPARRRALEQEIRNVKAGIQGENQILYELKNSHMPLFVLHDIVLEGVDCRAQIDFVVITPKVDFILECKNLYGDIEITQDGKFNRLYTYGGKFHKEGVYSPVTQNERHLELIKAMKLEQAGAIRRALIGSGFGTFIRSLVVLANSKTVPRDANAPQYIKDQVVRADQLIRKIKEINAAAPGGTNSEKEMRQDAQWYLDRHAPERKDYAARFLGEAAETAPPSPAEAPPEPAPEAKPTPEPQPEREGPGLCPRCGGQLTYKKGRYGPFYGCENYRADPPCTYTRQIGRKKEEG